MMRSLSRRRNERHIASKHGFGPADEQATRDGDPHSPGHGRMLGVTLVRNTRRCKLPRLPVHRSYFIRRGGRSRPWMFMDAKRDRSEGRGPDDPGLRR